MKILVDTQTWFWIFNSENKYCKNKVIELSTLGEVHMLTYVYEELANATFHSNVVSTKSKWETLGAQIADILAGKYSFFKLVHYSDIKREINCRDKNDDFIINTAIQKKYDLLITSDKDLLELQLPNNCGLKIQSIDSYNV